MLEIKNLIKSFNGNRVLKGINLKVEKGERLVIIGPSGCGKTTLLRCINGLEKPDAGEIVFGGQNICEQDKKELINLRKKMGMVFQAYNLFPHLKVIDNLTLALIKLKIKSKGAAEKEAMEILKKVNLLDKANEYPKNLSGGEKQRVAIARTLIMHPDLILVDEPTSSLDPKAISELIDLFKMTMDKDITMIIISHEMNFVKNIATRVAFINDGKIVEEESPENIFQNPKDDNLKLFIQNIKN